MSKNDVDPSEEENLRAAIQQAFADDEILAPLNLRVGVLRGIVHLGGNAPSLEIRVKAEQLAENFPGVRGVVNRIEAPGAPSPSRTINLNFSEQEKKWIE